MNKQVEAAAPEALHVMVGVIENAEGEILVAQRPAGKRYGGYWEFPGGKREPGESPKDALARELEEELGLQVQSAQPLMSFLDPFADMPIRLDVWRVQEYSGRFCSEQSREQGVQAEKDSAEMLGQEGQLLKWADQACLAQLQFPPANHRIFKRLSMGRHYGITGPLLEDVALSHADRLAVLQNYVDYFDENIPQDDYAVLQIRAHGLSDQQYHELISDLSHIKISKNRRFIANRYGYFSEPKDVLAQLGVVKCGVHVPQSRLMALNELVLDSEEFKTGELKSFKQAVAAHVGLVGASCHDLTSLMAANNLGLDYALLSPVLATNSHPDADGIGWSVFQQWAEAVDIPVYALGGMTLADMPVALGKGAQGLAGIGAFVGEGILAVE